MSEMIIEPGQSIGPFALGCTREQVVEVLGPPASSKELSPDVTLLEYRNIRFWLKSGKATQIMISKNHPAKLRSGAGLGASLGSFVKEMGCLYETNRKVLLLGDPPGLGVEAHPVLNLTLREGWRSFVVSHLFVIRPVVSAKEGWTRIDTA